MQCIQNCILVSIMTTVLKVGTHQKFYCEYKCYGLTQVQFELSLNENSINTLVHIFFKISFSYPSPFK